ncbi:PREDICTED: AMSH-like ubiquitin thioesterase 1 [Camelina sativa]|uniref:AMSH-like ubiquitin thioesterase 1 n=1 Tax=Camelina sativa TaxID=90675 RepID=A0ABM0X1Q0_CAMSA|nr:PREDICTED: AMSH-like ubiquitin thioesterase 1 [Camelina sativa]XP_019094264.1 PREDICTED: AMSH-like ubiquitin thioesterase 1 [Camelina sativa]
MGSSSCEVIDISTSARRIGVDNRISLRFYFRIADNILKQANIFRAEKNVIDLYVMLLRFSSLALETIPSHRDYRSSLKSNKEYLRMRLLDVLTELEKLKPVVQQRIDELNPKLVPRYNVQAHPANGSLGWSSAVKPSLNSYDHTKVRNPPGHNFGYMGSRGQQFLNAAPLEERFRKMSVNFRPNEETLSKHSVLGPGGLRAQWQPPKNDIKVQYPSNIDFSPVEIPSFQQFVSSKPMIRNDSNDEPERPIVESSSTSSENIQKNYTEELSSMISFEEPESVNDNSLTRQPSPPPVLAEVQDLVPALCPEAREPECKIENSLPDESLRSESPLELHIATTMMDTFMRLAKSNTRKNLETCGILAGSLKNRKFYITALIIPKQESTSDSCQATNEEEIFEVQDKQSLFPLGWIHTHPTQSCFMSSIDVHTHYSYQIMLPEAVAIVMAPQDSSRNHGIFRLTTPGGMTVIRNCDRRGFHSHSSPADGGPIYNTCKEVYMNPNLKFDVIDLR